MNHAENDHSSALPLVLPLLPNATIVTNAVCKEHLCILYPVLKQAKFKVINDQTTLELNDMKLNFLQVPLLHWPDSMFTYCGDIKTLFSNDGFGQHLASSERFVDELGYPEHALRLMKEYNANILGPFQTQLARALKAASTLQIEKILPAHGCGWRGKSMNMALKEYNMFSENKQMLKKVSVIFQSVEGSIKQMAEVIASSAKIPVAFLDLNVTDITSCAFHAYESEYLAFGSPTIHGEIAPKVESIVHYLQGLNLIRSRKIIIFTTFGWADKASKYLKEQVEAAGGIVVLQKQVKLRPTPDFLITFSEEAAKILTQTP